jgi:hypothetical protein
VIGIRVGVLSVLADSEPGLITCNPGGMLNVPMTGDLSGVREVLGTSSVDDIGAWLHDMDDSGAKLKASVLVGWLKARCTQAVVPTSGADRSPRVMIVCVIVCMHVFRSMCVCAFVCG